MASTSKFDNALDLIPYSASASSFFVYIMDSMSNKQKITQDIRSCLLDDRKCRFNVWRMLMGVFTIKADRNKKVEELNSQRQSYKNKKSEAYSGVGAIKSQVPIPKNPLMKAMIKTPKIEQVDDHFLKDQIRKDVERTYQQQQFFQEESIIRLLSTVLFVWCKKNPEVSYKQGMNQVLASIVYVYFQEVYTTNRTPEGFNLLTEENKNLYILFNSIEHAEADIYGVFEKIMNIQHHMYKTETDSNLKGVINPNSKNNTPILQRVQNIIDQKLKALDIQLFRNIKLFQVQTKTFLLRWIRCMHTRQFSLENSFIIWDSIFLDYSESPTSKDKNQFEFIDAMCVAMFVYMRSLALTRETAMEIQQIYQKYPSLQKGGYLEELIEIAWSICQTLRQPSALVSTEEVAQNSKADIKIVTFKNYSQPTVVEKPKQTPTKPKQTVKQVKEVKEVKEVKPAKPKEEEPKHVEVKVEQKPPVKEQKVESTAFEITDEVQHHQKEPMYSDFNFPIVLAAAEWQLLVDKLQKSLALNTDEESRKFAMQAMEIIKSKVESA